MDTCFTRDLLHDKICKPSVYYRSIAMYELILQDLNYIYANVYINRARGKGKQIRCYDINKLR